MQRTNLYLEERQTRALDQLAVEAGVSRAEMVRRILDRALAGGDDALTADLGAIDISYGCLASVELDSPVREPDERAEHLAELWGGEQ